MTREYRREIFLWRNMEKHYYHPDPTAKEALIRAQSSAMPNQKGNHRVRSSDLQQLPSDERLRALNSLKPREHKISEVMRTVMIFEARKEKRRERRQRR